MKTREKLHPTPITAKAVLALLERVFRHVPPGTDIPGYGSAMVCFDALANPQAGHVYATSNDFGPDEKHYGLSVRETLPDGLSLLYEGKVFRCFNGFLDFCTIRNAVPCGVVEPREPGGEFMLAVCDA